MFRYGDPNSAIFAIRYVGVSPDVLLGRKNRDWLSENDGKALQKLMLWVDRNKRMHGKVHRAYWNHENAMRSYYLDIRWTLIVSAFEALLNTKDSDATWQFRDRVRQLGDELKMPFPFADDEDYVFPSIKLNGQKPRSASMLVEDYIRPAALLAGVIRVENGITYDRDGEIVERFGFHVLGRHSIATFLMENETNPAVVQAVMRHSKMDMTLYYSHTHRAAKRAEREKVLQHLVPEEMRVQVRVQGTIQ